MQKEQPKKTKRTEANPPKSVKLSLKPHRSVWVISDIHACVETLARLLDQISFHEESLYIFLGDYINKGLSPLATLNLLRSFSNERKVIFIRGNHDQMLMDAWRFPGSVFEDQIIALKSQSLLERKSEYQPFFEQTLHFVESESHYFVHAGFDFRSANVFEDIERMMMIREIHYDAQIAKSKTIIRGHFPHKLEDIVRQIDQKNKVISLDNGCVYTERPEMGNLLAYEVVSGKLIIQPNVDQM